MRPSPMSARGIRRGVIVSIAVAASLVLAGCSSATTTGSAEPAPTPSATETVSREAGWFSERIRVCVANKTSRNLEYYFDEGTVDDQLEYIPRTWVAMGINAFACGASENLGPLADTVSFAYKDSGGRLVQVRLQGSKPPVVLTVYTLTGKSEEIVILTADVYPGTPYSGVAGGERIELLMEPTVRTFGKITAIPADLRISDAP